jgi:hypothetical protein
MVFFYFYDVLEVHYLLPDGIVCLPHAFSDTSSVSSVASSCKGFCKLLAVMFGILRLSLDECIVYYFGLNDYSGARIIVFSPLGEIRESSLATLKTAITESNHNKAGGDYAYI